MIQLKSNLHFFGPQGSGKGTQAEFLANKLNYHLISTGKLFRDRSAGHDEFARHLKKVLNEGLLVPVGIFERVLEDAVNEASEFSGIIFDGAVRSMEQVKVLATVWSRLNLDEPWIIVLNIPDVLAIERIGKRLTCENCGFVTSVNFFNQALKICPKCKIGHFKQRTDDTIVAIKERLKIYHRQTKEVIKYFKNKNRVIILDGAPPVEEVSKNLIKTLSDKKII